MVPGEGDDCLNGALQVAQFLDRRPAELAERERAGRRRQGEDGAEVAEGTASAAGGGSNTPVSTRTSISEIATAIRLPRIAPPP